MSKPSNPRFLVTGATGRLGRHVVDELLKRIPAADVAALVRNFGSKADPLRTQGVATRTADYGDPAALQAAMAGIERLLLISSSELGVRVRQHHNVIEAAKASGVMLIAYTSVLHADRSTLSVAEDHRRTEAMLAASGIPFVLLRNGWYTDNLMSSLPAALADGELLGAAGAGRISSAERTDFAAAAAAALTAEDGAGGQIYELAGDHGYTLAELAAEVSRQCGRKITYRDLSEAQYKDALVAGGLPEHLAALLSSSHAAVAKGALFDDSRDLARLIGRPTTPMSASVGATIRHLAGRAAPEGADLGRNREIFQP